MRSYRALILGAPVPPLAAVLTAWLGAGHSIAALATPARRGRLWRRDRAMGLIAPQWSVGRILRQHRIVPIEVPALRCWPERAEFAGRYPADVLISVYFPHIVPVDILARFPARAVNLHPALLPRYRGRAPLQVMLFDRMADRFGGVTLHMMSEGVDEGDVIASRAVPFPRSGDPAEWEVALAQACGALAASDLPRFLEGAIIPQPQDPAAASFAVPSKETYILSPQLTAEEMEWRVKALGSYRSMQVEGLPRQPVMGYRRIVSPPTGAPPSTSILSVEFDAADARVRLRRRLLWSRRAARFRRRLHFRRAPVLP